MSKKFPDCLEFLQGILNFLGLWVEVALPPFQIAKFYVQSLKVMRCHLLYSCCVPKNPVLKILYPKFQKHISIFSLGLSFTATILWCTTLPSWKLSLVRKESVRCATRSRSRAAMSPTWDKSTMRWEPSHSEELNWLRLVLPGAQIFARESKDSGQGAEGKGRKTQQKRSSLSEEALH